MKKKALLIFIVPLIIFLILFITAFVIKVKPQTSVYGDGSYSISVIGGADGPTSVFVAGKLGGKGGLSVGKIMEAIFCILYIIAVTVLGCLTVIKGKKNKEKFMYGIMSLILVFGDSFHLIPRIAAAVNPMGDYAVSLGVGKLITSITMTIFYLILYRIYCMRYEYNNKKMDVTMYVLTAARILLCLLPQNDWTGLAPVIWGIYRNIPFVIIGIIIVVLFYKEKADKPLGLMWLAVTLSFLFYIPVVLWADVSPMIGMLMMPKTCMYVWIVVMGYKLND